MSRPLNEAVSPYVENPSKNSSLASVRPRMTAGSDLLIFLKSRDKIEALLKKLRPKRFISRGDQ